MQCLVCRTKRCKPIELEENLKAVSCEACGGHWISHANYTAWLEKHGAILPEKELHDIEFDLEDVQAAKICPDCEKILIKYKVGHGLDFFVDRCSGCGSIWLDKGEWEALQAKNLHDEIHKVFSSSWQSKLRDSSMREKIEKAYANRFGPETYGRLSEFRAWLQEHPQKKAVLAFLADDDPYEV